MKIYLASDHRGFELKEKIKKWLKRWGYKWEDVGAFEFNPVDDYVDFVSKAVEKVSQNPKNCKAIILGATGQGEAMVANRFKNVRAVVFYGGDKKIISLSREHNNSNVLSLGASFVKVNDAKKAIHIWLKTPFSFAKRHKRRILKIEAIRA